jgi:predicted DCC family thiol-disulfide oxidoreductase YuxK
MANKEPTSPLWPIQAIGVDAFSGHGLVLLVGTFMVTLLTVMFPFSFLLRLCSFLSVFFFAAFQNSFGAFFHSIHFLVFVSFAFLFLPTTRSVRKQTTRQTSMKLVSIFWFVQFSLLYFYTIAGIWKVYGTGLAIFWSETMMRTVVSRAIGNGGQPIIAEQMVASNMMGSQLFYLVNLAIQLFSFFVFFRPALHKIYGFALCAFHLGTYLLLHITFPPHIIVWGLFFIMSPLAPRHFNLIDICRSIPFIQYFFSSPKQLTLFKSGQGAKLVYDGECPYCSRYVEFMRLKESVGKVELINARDGGETVDYINSRNINLDEGMVFLFNGQVYYGADALNVISLLSSGSTFYSKLNRILFRNKLIASLCYPILKLGRAITLKVIGVKKINAQS